MDHFLPITFFILYNGFTGYAAWKAAVDMLPDGESLSERVCAAAAIYFAFVVCVTAAAGLSGKVGLLDNPLIIMLLLLRSRPQLEANGLPLREHTRNTAGGRCVAEPLPIAVRLFLGVAVAAVCFMFMWSVVTPPPPGGDGFIYHLYFPATWLMRDNISYVALPYGAQAATYYPLNTELFYLWLMYPLHDDFMTNTAQLFALIVAACGVYRLSRKLGAKHAGAVAGACVALLIPGFVQQAGVARVDIFFSLWFLLSVLFLFRWRETGRGAYVLLSGICCGLFLGTKSLAVLYGVCIAGAFVAAAVPNGFRKSARALATILALMVPAGGFWFIRNWIVCKNPFYPLEFKIGGATIFHGAYGSAAMKTFHASSPSELLRISELFLGRGTEAMLVLSAATVAVLFVTRRGFARDRRSGFALYVLSLPLLICALFWFGNPHNNLTNGRFLFPAFLLACVWPALAIGDGGGGRGKIFMGLVPAALLAGSLQPGSDHLARMIPDILAALAGKGSALLAPAAWALRSLGVAALICAGAFYLSGVLRERERGRTCGTATYNRIGAIAAGAAVVFFFAGMALTWNYYGAYRYVWLRATAGTAGKGWHAFESALKKPVTVANVGNERAYPLFGDGLRNRVVMVNVDSHRDWQFHDYDFAARASGEKLQKDSERPQYHREHADPDAWMENLAVAGVKLLYCTNLEPISLGFMRHTPDGFPIEVQWMRERPRVFKKLYSIDGAPGGGGDTYAVEVYEFLP